MGMSLNPATGFTFDQQCPYCKCEVMAESDKCPDCNREVENWERADIFQLSRGDKLRARNIKDNPKATVQEHVKDVETAREEYGQDEQGYIAEVDKTGTTIYVPYGDLEEFEVIRSLSEYKEIADHLGAEIPDIDDRESQEFEDKLRENIQKARNGGVEV